MRLQFILVEELDPPPGAEQIVWLLATTLAVESLPEALICIGYYALRWLIERFHYVLKSGCRIEQLYLQTPERLLRALAIYSIVAWRLLWLTYEARQSPTNPVPSSSKPTSGRLYTVPFTRPLCHLPLRRP